MSAPSISVSANCSVTDAGGGVVSYSLALSGLGFHGLQGASDFLARFRALVTGASK